MSVKLITTDNISLTGGTIGQVLSKGTGSTFTYVDAGGSEPSGTIKSFTKDYLAAGDGVTDDTVKINNALLSERVIEDNGSFLTSGFTAVNNIYGTPIQGDVKFLYQTVNGIQQSNSYADKYQHIFGTEYLSSFHKKLISNATGGTQNLLVSLNGDSTTGGDGSTSSIYHLDSLLTQMTAKHGIPHVTYVNHGRGGTTAQQWLDTYLAQDLSENPDVYIIRQGINDTATSGMTARGLLNIISSGLTIIRSNSAFTESKLSIILCSQSTTTDDQLGHKGQIFNEEYNKGLRVLARKFNCCYMDVYALWQDSYNGQDYLAAYDSGKPNELIHPQNVLYIQIASKTFDVLFPDFYRNGHYKDNGYSTVNSAIATTYFKEGINYDFVLSEGGYPINGLLVTNVNNLGMGSQYLSTYDTANPIVHFRSFYGGSYRNWGQIYPPVVVGLVNDRGSQPNNTLAPSGYTNGTVTYDFGLTANGFPINGLLETDRSAQGFAKQTLTTYDSATAIYVRVGYNATWQTWKQLGIPILYGNGTVLQFTNETIYGTKASPVTGSSITVDTTGALLGTTVQIIHNAGTAPTFDTPFKKLSGSGSYVTGVLNYIFCEYIADDEIVYSINQTV